MLKNFLAIYLCLSVTLIFTFYPMMMMVVVLALSLIMMLMIGILNKSFWFSYILFMVMISGLMVLFLYMLTMIPNKLYKLNVKYSLWLTISLLAVLILLNNTTLLNFSTDIFYSTSQIMTHKSLIKMYNDYNTIIILMMNYLFLILIVSTKLINLTHGPLRTS